MSSKERSAQNTETRALDVLTAIDRIKQFIEDISREGFFADQKTQSAVERELLTISEACHKIGQLEQQQKTPMKARLANKFPRIPWRQISGIGNLLRHDYARVDPEIIWATITSSDLKNLKTALLQAFPRLKDR